MATATKGVIGTLVAGANLSATEYRFVLASTATNGECLVAGAGGLAVGIRDNAPASGSHCSIVYTGITKLTIGSGGCTAGMLLKSDADGKGVEADTDKDIVGAIAMESASENEVASVLKVFFKASI